MIVSLVGVQLVVKIGLAYSARPEMSTYCITHKDIKALNRATKVIIDLYHGAAILTLSQ